VPDLRVIDFGRVSALRSQTLWHALAYGVSAGGRPTLSFMRPSRPYVGLGYHRRLEEADLDACREAGLPVPRSREAAMRRLLEPAVTAFRAVGVPAELDGDSEIVVGDAKVCGHGAAQIEDAVVVVGNLIERFDHVAAARALALPDDVRGEVIRLMERYVLATPADPAAFRSAAIAAYADALGLEPVPGRLSPYERERLFDLDQTFRSPDWLRGPLRPAPQCSQVKIRAGVYVDWSVEQKGKAS
jgi:lipoate-protein ligase A